jgi:hypothetical protein
LDLFEKKKKNRYLLSKSQETESSYPNLSHWIRNSKLAEETKRRKTKIAEELVTEKQQRTLRKDKNNLINQLNQSQGQQQGQGFQGPNKISK